MIPSSEDKKSSWRLILVTLMLICKNRSYGVHHTYELQMDKRVFRIAKIQSNSEGCPKCGKHFLYQKDDYFCGGQYD